MWLKGQAAECYQGIYHHVLLSDEFIVDLLGGYRLVHSSNSHLKAYSSDRSVNQWTPKIMKLYYPEATAVACRLA